jgi:hypothetical protein
MRDESKRERAVLAAYREHLVDAPRLSAKTLACAEASRLTIEKILVGLKSDHRALARLGALYEQAQTLDRSAAVAFVEGVLRAAGIGVSLVPDAPAESAQALLVEAAEAGAAVGRVQAAALRAAADGVVGPDEAAEIRREVIEARRQLADVQTRTEQLEAQVQPGLKGVRR